MLTSLLLLAVSGQTPQATPPTPTTPADQVTLPVILPKGTPIKLQLLRPLSSQSSKIGDNVMYCVAEDVKDTAGHVLVPAGTSIAAGQVDAKRGGATLTHWVGMLAFSADILVLPDTDSTSIPIHIGITDKAHSDYRTNHSLAPPKPTKDDVKDFQQNQQPMVDTLMGAIGMQQGSQALVKNPFSQNSAVMLCKVLKFKGSDQLVGQLNNIQTIKTNPFVNLVTNFKSAKTMLSFGKAFGIASSLTLLGAGIGLIEVIDYIKGLFRHVTIANGTIFDAYTTADTKVPISAPMAARSIWDMHVKVLKPYLFAHVHNTPIALGAIAPKHAHVRHKA